MAGDVAFVRDLVGGLGYDSAVARDDGVPGNSARTSRFEFLI
jgi:hypothetical protein